MSLNVGIYLLTSKNIQDAEFFLCFCLQNYSENEHFAKKHGKNARVKHAQLLLAQNEPEKALEVANRELEIILGNDSHQDEGLLTVLTVCNVHVQDFLQAAHWAKKLTNHKQNELISLKENTDIFGTMSGIGAQKTAKRPEDFTTLQREYKMTLNESDRYHLCRIEVAEVMALQGQLQMRAELFEVKR